MPKVLVGCLLTFLPLVNIFSLGYLYRYYGRARRLGEWRLPPWDDWERLLINGVYFLAVWACYGLLPLIAAGVLSSLLDWVTLGWLTPLWWTLMVVVFAGTLASTAAALWRFQENGRRWSTLLQVEAVLRLMLREWKLMIWPTAAYALLLVLLPPFFGVVAFAGGTVYLGFAATIFARGPYGADTYSVVN